MSITARTARFAGCTIAALALLAGGCSTTGKTGTTTAAAGSGGATHNEHPTSRPNWWSDARFGMFIHWGLYSVPAGVWGDRTDYGEWIRDSAHIPVGEYETLRAKFNPTKFDADAIVTAAKNAGMKYIVITSKHHDGFGLFDSKETDWDVMSTPFKRDILKELSEACARHGITMCWYYSIMDWHHPDYIPRRPWERASRPETGADMDRYVGYMKGQLKELLTKYGPIGLLWFDGQWEGSWNDTRGRDLARYVRSLQPGIIINSRVGRGGGAFGLEGEGGMIGDYATPEQEIPERAIRDTPWETCMTMNEHWGYNAADKNFKSSTDLIRKLADIASKGGNFLLNVGPTSEGEIPPESLERLAEIGKWTGVNGESIYGTVAGPYDAPLPWGCITQKKGAAGGTRLYLHVFTWPESGEIVLPGLLNESGSARLLSDAAGTALTVDHRGPDLVVHVKGPAPDTSDSVVVLDLPGAVDLSAPPVLSADSDIFVDSLDVKAGSGMSGAVVRYTLDGADPVVTSPIAGAGPFQVTATSTVAAACFRDGKQVSPVVRRTFTKVTPRPAAIEGLAYGVNFDFFRGAVKSVNELENMKPESSGTSPVFTVPVRPGEDNWCYRFHGFIRAPKDGVYTFWVRSDDGSRLRIGGQTVVDNDGPHSPQDRSGTVALAEGWHAIEVSYFENTGGHELDVSWSGPGFAKETVAARSLGRKP